MNLDVGDFKYASCSMDYNTIKLYLDNLKQFLNDVALITILYIGIIHLYLLSVNIKREIGVCETPNTA